MQTVTHQTASGQTASLSRRPDTRPLALRILDWLAERDRRHRDVRALHNMPRERLDDIGLTRTEAERLARE